MLVEDPVYWKYWERKRLQEKGLPHFPVLAWWADAELSDAERLCFNEIVKGKSVLDIGAGDLRMKKKFTLAGFRGTYHTQDIGTEFHHDYSDLAEINQKYDAILCFDVIEHLQLKDALNLIHRMALLLNENGVLIIQTPNARSVSNPLGWDMTHLHTFNLPDLWCYLSAMNLSTRGYRVVFNSPHASIFKRLQKKMIALFVSRVLGMDYAENILAIAKKQ